MELEIIVFDEGGKFLVCNFFVLSEEKLMTKMTTILM